VALQDKFVRSKSTRRADLDKIIRLSAISESSAELTLNALMQFGNKKLNLSRANPRRNESDR